MKSGLGFFLGCIAFSAAAAVADPTPAPGTDIVSSAGPQPLLSGFRSSGIEKRSIQRFVLPVPKTAQTAPKRNDANLIGVPRLDAISAVPFASRILDWRPTSGGQVALVSVTSTGAAALRVGLRFEQLPAGLEIRVANESTWDQGGQAQTIDAALAAKLYQGKSPLIWTPVTSGDTQVIELYATTVTPESRGYVENVSHLLFDPTKSDIAPSQDFEKLLSCEQNYSCTTNATIQTAGRAVARIVMTDVSGNTIGYCSGALLNDRSSTGTPWFATAAHCQITSQAIASNLQFFWYYELGCGTSTVNPNVATTVGSQYLLWDDNIDFSFLKVLGTLPSGLRLLGWDPNPLTSGTAVFGVHHPAGYYKAYSQGSSGSIIPVSFSELGHLFHISATAVSWSVGITEPGSSGSPLMSGDGIVRGTLSAGPNHGSCSTPVAAYAQFSEAYPRIKGWIDPNGGISVAHTAAQTYTTQQAPYTSTVQAGLLSSSSDQNWFRFAFPVTGYWLFGTVYAPGAPTDTVGNLYASDTTTLLDSNDNDPTGTFGLNFLLFGHVTRPDTFFVRVTGENTSAGPYALYSLFEPDDPDGHGGFPWLGTPLSPNGSDTGELVRAGDIDYFIIDVPSAGTLSLSTSGATDTVGYLYDSQLSVVARSDDASATNTNFLIQKALSPGRYYLAVLGYDITVRGPYFLTATFTAPSTGGTTGAVAKTLGSRATVRPGTPMYGAFELSEPSLVYILVRGNSLGTLGVTPSYLDAPRLRLFDSQGNDLLHDALGAQGIAGCNGTVANYYASARQQPADQRDACVAQSLPAGVYTFNVSPSSAGLVSSTASGEVLFEVTLANGSGTLTKTLGSRASVNSTQPMYGAFELARPASVYILVRGDSLGTLGVTPRFLDAPRLRLFDSQGRDMLQDSAGIAGVAGCSGPVANYYANARHQAASDRDACVTQSLAAGVYTFNVTPSSSGLLSTTPTGGEVLFEVTLSP